jgi:hypothetical protein
MLIDREFWMKVSEILNVFEMNMGIKFSKLKRVVNYKGDSIHNFAYRLTEDFKRVYNIPLKVGYRNRSKDGTIIIKRC